MVLMFGGYGAGEDPFGNTWGKDSIHASDILIDEIDVAHWWRHVGGVMFQMYKSG